MKADEGLGVERAVNHARQDEATSATSICSLRQCFDTEFHGIDCIECEDEYGFEGCYMDRLDHPDPRPGHQIWLKKLHAEKLFRLFKESPELTQKTEGDSK